MQEQRWEGPEDGPGEGRRGGRFLLWAMRHPVLSALLLSSVTTLLVFGKSAFLAVGEGRQLHSSGRRLWIAAGVIEAIFFVMFAALHLAVARSRRRSGTPLTAEALNLPFVEDRDAAARRPPALLVLRPSLRQPLGLVVTFPLLVGVLTLVAAAVDVASGHRAVLWIGMAALAFVFGAWTTIGHRRQRIVVYSEDVYVYTFTGRYRRVDRSGIEEVRRTRAEPILVGGDGERLLTLPPLTREQTGELARALQVAHT
ncbi:hypothetical protein ABH920_003794 [Catenulispora sp. EB89]|uniref:hypothetical protein n=1 Tax=Catenulispora sp. EB89 TaxID=3156257 RepID=UPI0035171D22